jgi:UDP-N-acetyl-D-glucosamine dehydrogenase
MSPKQSRTLAIIGQGYVGLPLAMAAADAGWNVTGVDNLESRVSQINSGSSPVEDISDAKLQATISSGKYRATSEFSDVMDSSIIVICVPTPLNDKRDPDISLLCNAAAEIAPYLTNDALIICESTSYPGTLREVIIPLIQEQIKESGIKLHFASAPERVNPGDLKWNQKNTPRLVGAIDEQSQLLALEFYRTICDEVIPVSTPEIAEAAKLLENTFRLVNIALINEFTKLCSTNGINVNDVIDAASSKPYGFMTFRPGVGVGGHCIPIDPLYLTWWARENGMKAEFIECADSINNSMPEYVANRVLDVAGADKKNPKVLILGVAYKSGVGDVRETPASKLRNHLIVKGATVAWNDPLVPIWESTNPVEINWECDVVVLMVRQPGMNLDQLKSTGSKIFDCTNSLAPNDHTFFL